MSEDRRTDKVISSSILRLRSRAPFFGTLALYADWIPESSISTACTNGREVYYNPDFFASLCTADRDFVIAHEIAHMALRHVGRRGPRDPRRWNIACDIVVNGLCERAGLQPMPGALRDRKRESLRAEDVYAQLKDVSRARLAKLGANIGGKLRDLDDRATSTGSVEADRRWDGYWRQALRRAATSERMLQSNAPGLSSARELAGVLEPQMNWRTMLWRYVVKSPTDYVGFDRRFIWRGDYIDALDGERLDVHICVDTSGSINRSVLERFVGEVKGICACHPNINASLWYADSSLYGPWTITQTETLPTPQGGGGTDFRPFFRAVQRRQHLTTGADPVAVYLTDGLGSFPREAPLFPVLWVGLPGGRDVYPFGELVKMEDAVQ